MALIINELDRKTIYKLFINYLNTMTDLVQLFYLQDLVQIKINNLYINGLRRFYMQNLKNTDK